MTTPQSDFQVLPPIDNRLEQGEVDMEPNYFAEKQDNQSQIKNQQDILMQAMQSNDY